MKYLIESDSTILTQKAVETIIKDNNINKDSIYILDFDIPNAIVSATIEYLSSSIFFDKKLIIIRNFSPFKNLKVPNKEIKIQLNELFNVETENILVLDFNKFNEKNEIIVEHKDNIELIKLAAPTGKQMNTFIKNYFKKEDIIASNDAIQRLIEITEGDFDTIVGELKKLVLINEEVTIELLAKTIYDRKGENIFKLLDYI
jgi:DNA polymerase-3 subunit delta